MAQFFKMLGRDVDCLTETWRSWVVVGAPDTTGAQYAGTKCGATQLADITVAEAWLSPDPSDVISANGSFDTTDNVPHTMFSLPIPTASDMAVEIEMKVRVKSGPQNGKSFYVKAVAEFENPGGTPAAPTGAQNPASGWVYSRDGSGLFGGAALTYTFSPNTAYVVFTGIAATNCTVRWWYKARPSAE